MRNPPPQQPSLSRTEEERRNYTLGHARGMLHTARKHGHYVGLAAELHRLTTTFWPFELAEIGTTAAEVEQLSRNGLLPTAILWLHHLRHPHPDCANGLPVMMVREYLKLAGAKPEAIGATEAELSAQERHYPDWVCA